MEPFFLLPPFPGDEGPWSLPGILLHFAIVIGLAYALARLLWRRLPSTLIAVASILAAFGLGVLWRHISWDFWATWDDLIIDPFKGFQFLHPRGENIACIAAFTLAPFLIAWWSASVVVKRIKRNFQLGGPANGASPHRMSNPVLNVSLAEIRDEIADTIAFLESTSSKHPSWSWPPSVLVLVREFEALAAEPKLDPECIHDFTLRLTQHIRTHRLKGMDPLIWYAEALERLANIDNAA